MFMHSRVCVQVLVLSYYAVFGDQTQVIRLDDKPYPLRHLAPF